MGRSVNLYFFEVPIFIMIKFWYRKCNQQFDNQNDVFFKIIQKSKCHEKVFYIDRFIDRIINERLWTETSACAAASFERPAGQQ